VAEAIASGLEAGGLRGVDRQPIADGGEGTMEVLLAALGGRYVARTVTDPLGRPVEARFALLEEGRLAVVEMAEASGLARLAPQQRDAERASSAGTGQLIAAAVEAGAREIVVAVGGSATTDGGRGALEALGARFVGDRAKIDPATARLSGVRLVMACDVNNPLSGPKGAAQVFAPQKGADAAATRRLAVRLERWADLALAITGRDPADVPGAGAAGGLAGGFWAFAGAELRSGADWVLDAVGFDSKARDSGLVITGEGRLDSQTLGGKAVAAAAVRSLRVGTPCIAVVGQCSLSATQIEELGIDVVEAARGTTASLGDIKEAAIRLADSRAMSDR
jgi:glycerate 2-kinase